MSETHQASLPLPYPEAPPLKLKIDSMSPQAMEARRREICASAMGDYEKLTTEELQELSYITSSLRRRTSGPPKVKASSTKSKPTLDDL